MGMVAFIAVNVLSRVLTFWFSAMIAMTLFGFDSFGRLWRAGMWRVLGVVITAWIFYLVFRVAGAALARALRSSRG